MPEKYVTLATYADVQQAAAVLESRGISNAAVSTGQTGKIVEQR